MGLGLMNKKAYIEECVNNVDEFGFNSLSFEVLKEIKVYVEERHGSLFWANLAKFSEATFLFRFRYFSSIKLIPNLYILYNEERYLILSIENIKSRNMYFEVLAKKVT